jgi:hypothetical protein
MKDTRLLACDAVDERIGLMAGAFDCNARNQFTVGFEQCGAAAQAGDILHRPWATTPGFRLFVDK